jgi:hypothetical protein
MKKITRAVLAVTLGFTFGFGVSAPALAALKYEKKNYYVELARTKTDNSTSLYSVDGHLDVSSLRATELRMGYFVMPDISIEIRYDGGDKIALGTSNYQLKRKGSYGVYAKKQAELASGFNDQFSVNGYVMLGLAKNNQTISLYGNELDNQNRVGLEWGVGLEFEVKKTVYLNLGATSRGAFDSNSITSSTRHRSLDVGLGVKF